MAATPGTRQLTLLYILALSAIALLTILGQVAVQRSLTRQLSASTRINTAGRQRMLSQKLTKTVLLLSQSDGDAASLKDQLAADFAEWRSAHQRLLEGDDGAPNSEAVAALFRELAPHYQAMSEGLERLQAGETTAALAPVLQHEPAFLRTMDAIVNQYDLEAQADVSRLRTLERVLLAITLGVLLLEGMFIFRPAVARLRSTLRDLAQAKQAAEDASAEKSRFLARMSHDLRTPLNAILGIVDVQLAQAGSDPPAHLRTIRDAGEAQLCLVDALLEGARAEVGSASKVESAPVELAELIERTVGLFAQQARLQGLTLSTSIESNLPKRIVTDARMLQQIVMNLVGNALKFTRKGSVCVDVRRHNGKLAIAVRDTGIGIPPAEHRRIFDSFTQLGVIEHREGLGLGLSIVARFVAQLGGEVALDSTPGQGSCFTVLLPMQEATASEAHAVKIPDVACKHVLVVEDTAANQFVCEQMLDLLGHRAAIAGTVAEGLALASKRRYDVVLLDMQLPDGSGIELARKLRGLPEYTDVALISISANATVEQREAAQRAGIRGHLVKPVRLPQLAALLGKASKAEIQPADLTPLVARPELLRGLVDIFQREWPGHLEQLDQALASGDLSQAKFIAHRLRGLASNFHHAASDQAIDQLHDAAERGDLPQARAHRAAVANVLAALASQLNAATNNL